MTDDDLIDDMRSPAGVLLCSLEFHPASETPTTEGQYLIYNQCDGLHIVHADFDGEGFVGFKPWMEIHVSDDFYCAWALLPESSTTLFDAFAENDEYQECVAIGAVACSEHGGADAVVPGLPG